MKVTGFEVFPVVCPPPFRGGRSWLFVRLDTDGGTHGYGEMMMLGSGFRLPVLATMMADIIYDDPAARPVGGSLLSRDVWLNPAHAAARARHYVDQGFTAIKVDPFSLVLTHDQSLGQNVPLQFSLSAAGTAERYEEPCPPENMKALADVARRTTIPIATVRTWPGAARRGARSPTAIRTY